MFCVSYATPPTIHEHQEEEIYSSLKKVKRNNTVDPKMLQTGEKQQHITMIPLGSPHELRREPTLNGTVIRVASKSTDQPLGELIPKMRSTNNNTVFGSINNLSSKPSGTTVVKKDFESWSGRVMEGRIQTNGHHPHHRSTTNNMRGYWENNIQHERQIRAEEEKRNRPKSYGFPKWRSTDALSASLVASNSIQIPKDSRIPQERLRKMEETEREAIEVQREIQEEADVGRRRPLSKGKSLDSLYIMENAASAKPWYDAEQIKAAVSRESIANIATSRDFFENASNRDWSASRSRLSSLSVAPPLPPKSEAIQLRQSTYQPDMSSPQTIDPIEQQEVLLMLYLKQNLDIAQGLGIRIPAELMAEMEDLQMLPVELRICDEEPHRMFSPGMKNGRYQRKIQPQVSAHSSRPNIGQRFINKKQDQFHSNLDLSSNSTYSHHNNYGSSYAH